MDRKDGAEVWSGRSHVSRSEFERAEFVNELRFNFVNLINLFHYTLYNKQVFYQCLSSQLLIFFKLRLRSISFCPPVSGVGKRRKF